MLIKNIYNIYTACYSDIEVATCCAWIDIKQQFSRCRNPSTRRQMWRLVKKNVVSAFIGCVSCVCVCEWSCFVLEAATCVYFIPLYYIIRLAFISFSVIFLCLHPKTNSADKPDVSRHRTLLTVDCAMIMCHMRVGRCRCACVCVRFGGCLLLYTNAYL